MTGDRRLPRQTIQNAALKNPGESPVKGGREFTAGVEFNQQLVDLCVLRRVSRRGPSGAVRQELQGGEDEGTNTGDG
jgi:hypothetical protein